MAMHQKQYTLKNEYGGQRIILSHGNAEDVTQCFTGRFLGRSYKDAHC